MQWTRAIHLIHWADTQDARHQLPSLLGKLVRATIPKEHIKTVNFPSGEQVQRSGLDGVVEVSQGNQFVPTGRSAWEAGVNKGKKEKADKDFENRTKNTSDEQKRNETFVFVTLRTWDNKDEWAENQEKASTWKDVIVHDANDIEHWLELAPAVDVWLSTAMGRRPPGVIDIDRHWQSLASIADVPLKPEVFLSGRQSVVESIIHFLQEPPSSLFLKSDGWDDGVDFLAAVVGSGTTGHADFERFLVVTDVEAWRTLASSQEPLVLVASSNLLLAATDVAHAVKNGHHVLITGAHQTTQSRSIELPRHDSFELYQGLEECGFDEARAKSLSTGCCGSSTVLKRLITKHPDRVFPKWSQDENRTKLAPFALIGGWSHVDPTPPSKKDPFGIIPPPPLDLWFIEQLGLTRNEVEEAIARWTTGEEPLFIQFENSVLVGSREDAWYLLGGSLTAQQLQKFRDIASLILDEDNPALQMDPDKRWMANVYGKVHSLSGELRRSVVESLDLMSCYPTAMTPGASVDFAATVRLVLESILPKNASWQRWASLGRNLSLLAECDPEFMLNRIESDLATASPELLKLFESSSDPLFGSSLHCDLLWTLEGLAWSPDYLGRVARILAKLAAGAGDFKSGNNPTSSLEDIFLLWLPHTNATIEERIAAIESMVRSEPESGWRLTHELLPGSMGGTSTGTHMPRWRPWAHGWTREKASSQRAKYASQFGDMVLRLAGTEVRRWALVVEGMLRLGGPYTDKTIERLEEIASAKRPSVDECFELWDVLRQLTYRHSRYPDAPWAFPKETLDRLSAIRDRIEPQDDPVLKFHWLFRQHVLLHDVDDRDFTKHDDEVHKRRNDALKIIVSAKGIDGAMELLARTANPSAIGQTLGEHGIVGWKDLNIPAAFEAVDNAVRICALAYCHSRFWASGWPFIDDLPVREWSAKQAAILATCLKFERATWEWVAGMSEEVETLYWKQCRVYLREPTLPDVDYAIEKLLGAGRTFGAATLVTMCTRKDFTVDDGRVLNLLEQGMKVASAEDVEQSDYYPVQDLIERLQKVPNVDRGRLARIEWGYLPVLSRFSQVQPTALYEALCDDPQLFYDLLKVQYRAADEEPGDDPVSEHEQNLIQQAGELFEQFDVIPGTQPDGSIDAPALNAWVDKVREFAADGNRMGICDHRIGILLSHCPIPEQLDAKSHIVLSVLERIGSESLVDGFQIGTYNNRGTTIRMPTSGGELERALVGKYQTVSKSCISLYPKAATMFDEMARRYEHDASFHDVSAERTRLGR